MLNKNIRKYSRILYPIITAVVLFTMPRFAHGAAEKQFGPFVITYNGTNWKAYTDIDKVTFLQGFYQGAFYGALNSQTASDVNERELFLKTIDTYAYPDAGDLGTVAAEIDAFYSNENNLMIPVHEALVFIAKGKRNENMIKEEAAKWLDKARGYWQNK